MKIKINIDKVYGEDACVASQLSWDNPDVIAALENLFKIRKNEKIGRLEISEETITAYFFTK